MRSNEIGPQSLLKIFQFYKIAEIAGKITNDFFSISLVLNVNHLKFDRLFDGKCLPIFRDHFIVILKRKNIQYFARDQTIISNAVKVKRFVFDNNNEYNVGAFSYRVL